MGKKKGSKSGRCQVMLPDVDTRRLSELKYKLICRFKLAGDMVGGGIREFLNDMDGPAFLERELMRLDVDEYQ